MKPIPTRYVGPDGLQSFFRSRIEARYAVLFDTLRLQWRYEMQGFDLGRGIWYLPDFWLPELELWVEIKATPPMDRAIVNAALLAQQCDGKVAIFWGYFSRQSEGDTLEFHKDSDGVFHSRQGHLLPELLFGPFYDPGEMTTAYNVARQARFEEGNKR